MDVHTRWSILDNESKSEFLDKIWLRPNLQDDIIDLQWSPDSSHIIAGAIDSKAQIMRVTTRDTVMLSGQH